MSKKPHIVLVVPSGEAVRNFLYSDFLTTLSKQARVTLLSVITDESFVKHFRHQIEENVPLNYFKENWLVVRFRYLVHESHFRWIWSEVAKNVWAIRDYQANTFYKKTKRFFWKIITRCFAFRPILEFMTQLEQALSWYLRPTKYFDDLFEKIKPDYVFNTQHVHGPRGDLPIRVAHKMGIRTGAYIFSWDNLTSRSRIFAPYDDYFVWHEGMKTQLQELYPFIKSKNIHVTGTPQFDFHFKPELEMNLDELSKIIGFDPARPFILYTTGVDTHFPEEHRTVKWIANTLKAFNSKFSPQLVVRTYAKGTSEEMKNLIQKGLPDTYFPPILWDERWYAAKKEDLSIYTSLLKHAALGINAASTVSLELMMCDKPVINLGMDPPESKLPHCKRWSRHVYFDHYKPVSKSGAVRVAWSLDDLRRYISESLDDPQKLSSKRKRYIQEIFGEKLSGNSGNNIAERLLNQVKACSHKL